MQQVNQRKLLSAVCHGAIFFSSTIVSIGIPIAIMLTTNDSIVKQNAKESLNFHINLYIYAIVFSLLVLVAIGIPLLAVLAIVSFLMPILAILHILDDPNLPYRYPFIFRVL
ncbi:DUF4870 domain-containing protein [Brasilonema sp. UFV-L1]|uniref:DUF4870 domain-containing protein n=1 Tax=Brasilonema sp. UFV-L1 TaxID=2234130 RepID=UPI00145C574F|nr:DUF4870 domain-containing protein [Brasilonema sp. UFV-L1]NMG09430.1 DUF4870 domain-containing protein [Brasilonema sp. UFV-L1]